MTPTLDFLDRNPALMAEMIADFQQRKKIVDMAKTREPIDANVIENPNQRAFLPYPKMMYHHARRITLQVDNATDHENALAQGWKEQPWPSVDPGVPIGPQTTADPMDEERMTSLENRMLMLEQGLGDILAQLQLLGYRDADRVGPTKKRKPGRPPHNSQE